MIVGILSDTHGDAVRTAQAVRILRRAGAAVFVHCGDVGGEDVLDELAGLDIHIIDGNTDSSGPARRAYAAALELRLYGPGPRRLELDGRVLVVFHGHERLFGQLMEHGAYDDRTRAELAECDYILHGHSHVPRDMRLGRWRVINPGALRRVRIPTVATLDLRADEARFWRVGEGPEDAPLRPFFPLPD